MFVNTMFTVVRELANGIISPKLGTEISLKYMKIDIVVFRVILQWILGTGIPLFVPQYGNKWY